MKFEEYPEGTKLTCMTRRGQTVRAVRCEDGWKVYNTKGERLYEVWPHGRLCDIEGFSSDSDLMVIIRGAPGARTVVDPTSFAGSWLVFDTVATHKVVTDEKSANPPAPLQLKDRPLEDLKAMLAEIQGLIEAKKALPQVTFKAVLGIDPKGGVDYSDLYALDSVLSRQVSNLYTTKAAETYRDDWSELHEVEVTIKGIRRIK